MALSMDTCPGGGVRGGVGCTVRITFTLGCGQVHPRRLVTSWVLLGEGGSL